MALENVLRAAKVVPVVALTDADDAVPMAKALMAGGINAIEITLRTPAAMQAVRNVMAAKTGISVGVGTIITTEQVAECAVLGVDFIVTPGTTPRLADAIAEHGVPCTLGISTVGEAVAMLERGYELVKFFPAEACGGITTLKAIGGPLPQLKFMPTGGIGQDKVANYLALNSVVCVGGSWVCDKVSVANKDWAQITAHAKIAQSL